MNCLTQTLSQSYIPLTMNSEFDNHSHYTHSQSVREQEAWAHHVKIVNRQDVRRAIDWETRHLQNELALKTQELESVRSSPQSDTDESWEVYQGESQVPEKVQIQQAWDAVQNVWEEKTQLEEQLEEFTSAADEWQWDEEQQAWWQWDYEKQDWSKWALQTE